MLCLLMPYYLAQWVLDCIMLLKNDSCCPRMEGWIQGREHIRGGSKEGGINIRGGSKEGGISGVDPRKGVNPRKGAYQGWIQGRGHKAVLAWCLGCLSTPLNYKKVRLAS